MVVDRNLEIAEETEQYDRQKEMAAGPAAGKGLSPEEIDLFAGLLEMADAGGGRPEDALDPQAGDDAAAAQMAADIRYYLHTKDVEAVDWSPKYAAWFEMLPALPGAVPGGKQGASVDGKAARKRDGSMAGTGEEAITIRPALAQDGRLLKKGIAVR